MDKRIEQLLRSPTAEYRAKPFWAWNGKLEKEELLAQVDRMYEMGFGGFFMHSRTGLGTEYLGEEWFSLIRLCAERAKELGMEAWLYDEDRWPSGTCGGEVTKERKNRLRFLSLYQSDEEALARKEVVGLLSRYAVRLKREDGEDRLLDCYPVESAAEVGEGYCYCVFAEEEQAEEDFYNGCTYIDAMNPAVTEKFLKTTHEKYFEHCGDLFGNAIKGIFTDEPHRGALFTGFSLANENRLRMAPYTAALPAAFAEKTGRAFCPPALYWRRAGEDFNTEACDYIDVVDDLFTQNFAKPCRDWCAAHGLILTGHILHEDSLSIQASLTGSCMRYYEYMDYPGIDVLGEHTYVPWAVKQCASAARQLGKKFVLSELYGATGWDMTFDRYKQVGDLQAFYGINLRCPHLSWYTMKGEAKRDYPASILHQNAWWREWKCVEDYFARLSVLSAEGKRVATTLVIVPLREMWGKVRMGWMEIFTPHDGSVSALDEEYADIFRLLTERNIDFDYGDEELLVRYGKVLERQGKTCLQVGEAIYEEVLWTHRMHETPALRELLAEFGRRGGKLTERAEELSPAIRILTPENVACTVYEIGDDRWLSLLNLDREHGTSGTVILPEEYRGYAAEKWDLCTGESLGEVKTVKGGFLLSLVGGEGCAVRLTHERVKPRTEKNYPAAVLPERFAYTLTEPNVLPLDEAVWEMDGEVQNGGEEEDVLLIDRAIRHGKGTPLRGGTMLQPWFQKLNGMEGKKLCDVKLIFSFLVENVPKEAYLAMEDTALRCSVNGVPLGEKCAKRWVDGCFSLYPIALKKGRNVITLGGGFCTDDGLEAIYLLGDFGVKLPKTLSKLPETLTAGDIAPQGLPFYTGGIRYRTGVKEGNYTLSFPRLGGAVMKVEGGANVQTLAFAPYCCHVELKDELVLELIFPRRNTFGPLHQPYPQPVYGPESFLTPKPYRTPFLPIQQGLGV